MPEMDFWFSIGSTYTYLTVLRINDVGRSSGVGINWRPFDVRHIMIAQDNIPFRDKPIKAAYMWRDIERRAEAYGLTPKLPAPYPLPGLTLANQIAIVGTGQGWVEDYTRAAYRRWFEQGEPAGEEPNMSGSLSDIGLDPPEILTRAQSNRMSEALEAATQEAMSLGVFGAPSFVVNGEVFWGDDRLDDAIRWARLSPT